MLVYRIREQEIFDGENTRGLKEHIQVEAKCKAFLGAESRSKRGHLAFTTTGSA